MGSLPRGRNEPLHGARLLRRRGPGGAEKTRGRRDRQAVRLFESAEHVLAPSGPVADVPGECLDGRRASGAYGEMNWNSERYGASSILWPYNPVQQIATATRSFVGSRLVTRPPLPSGAFGGNESPFAMSHRDNWAVGPLGPGMAALGLLIDAVSLAERETGRPSTSRS